MEIAFFAEERTHQAQEGGRRGEGASERDKREGGREREREGERGAAEGGWRWRGRTDGLMLPLVSLEHQLT